MRRPIGVPEHPLRAAAAPEAGGNAPSAAAAVSTPSVVFPDPTVPPNLRPPCPEAGAAYTTRSVLT